MAQSSTCKTIYFVRHAEGIHNRDSRAGIKITTMAYWDAPLTDIGVSQCSKLADEVRNLTIKPEVVVVSPLRRAIHTATLGFRPDGFGPPFVATELCRERISIHTCDGRRNLTDIRSDFGTYVDFSEIVNEFDSMWSKKEDVPNERESIVCAERALKFLYWLQARPEKVIAVVSHWVFYTHLFRLFGNHELRLPFGNAEMRSVMMCIPSDLPLQEEM